MSAVAGRCFLLRRHGTADDAARMRDELERLGQLGSALLGANTLHEVATAIVHDVVGQFGLQGASLVLDGEVAPFVFGDLAPQELPPVRISLQRYRGSTYDLLELHGPPLSEKGQCALASLIRLVLERARSAKERVEIEAARQGEELRSMVLNAFAHNFRTPLTSIKAAASALRQSGNALIYANVLSNDQRELIVVIDEEADRLDQLIEESLELARLKDPQLLSDGAECKISTIVLNVTSRTTRHFGNSRFIIEVPNDLPPVKGDSFLLEQMLLQVVDNAWKYSRPGTPISISAVISGGRIMITVQNEGSEIPPEERERIFSKFYRGSRDRAVVEGTGLGLAIARTIAEAHDGELWLDVEPRGPAFRFSLPVYASGRVDDRKPHHITH